MWKGAFYFVIKEKETIRMNYGTQMTSLMRSCYQGSLNEVQKELRNDISEREIYNALIMCREGHKHNPGNESYSEIINAIKKKYPNEIKPHSGQYAEFVLFDYRGPQVKYSMYDEGESKGLLS